MALARISLEFAGECLVAKQKIKTTARSEASAHAARPSQSSGPRASTTVGAIVILLLYQGYTLSIVGIASPWIAKSSRWMKASSPGFLRGWRYRRSVHSCSRGLADRVGRRLVILGALLLAPIFSAGAAAIPDGQCVRRMRG